jgi:uncharacterized protein (DUF2267 family)
MKTSMTGLDVFDKTLQTTNTWLSELMETLGPDRRVAWRVLGAVLRTIRDRIPLGLAAHLGAQLPLLIRGAYYDQWRPSTQPADWRSHDEFSTIISAELHDIRPVNAKVAARSVFQVLNHHITPEQVETVRDALPEDVRQLWPTNKAGAHAHESAA